MVLAEEERQKFILYLKQNVDSSRQLIEQLEKMPMGGILVKRERTMITAWMIVAAHLESLESFTVEGG